MGSDDDSDHGRGFFPPPTSPRSVRGGLRLQTKQGAPGATWWARRWLAALEAVGLRERLERGLDYARSGQVVDLSIEPGVISATVQGTRREPYVARLELAQLTQLEWLRVAAQLGARAGRRAALHAGLLPEDVEALFAREGLTLFPAAEDDLVASCTCVDWATPCRHVAAACYLAVEAFDREPLLLVRLRGIEPEVLLAMVDGQPEGDATDGAGDGAGAGDGDGDGAAEPAGAAGAAVAAGVAGWRVEDGAAAFWAAGPGGEPALLDLTPPALDAPLVRILGPLPAWRGVDDFAATMRRIGGRMASDPRALDVATGSVSDAAGA